MFKAGSVWLGFLLLVNVTAQAAEMDGSPRLRAELLASYPAAEAGQGAAADAAYFYAIVNTRIGKYSRRSGERIAGWDGGEDGPLQHINSCYVDGARLHCANSNFPELPMASSVEVFDTETMQHLESYSLGVMEEGSLTWFEPVGDSWIAGFAHYDERGGLEYKNHRFASVARFDAQWRRMGGWMLPEAVVARMQPYAASGGAIGADGLLYVTGHDRPEMYVLAAPKMGPKLVHIATIDIDVEGQAIAWDKSTSERILFGISRPNREVREFRIPRVDVPAGVLLLDRVD